jgi:hypothetical protein
VTDDDFMAQLKPAADAWHNLAAHADQLARLAANADPDKMPVASTYPYALAALKKAVKSGAFHEIYDAVGQFHAAFDLTGGLMTVVTGGAGENELALIGALLLAIGAKNGVDEAVAKLPPTSQEDPTEGETIEIPAEIRESAAAGDDLLERAILCARAAADADPDKMPVSDDYISVLNELDTVLASRPLIVYQVRDAARRYAAAFTFPEGAGALAASEAGTNEMALMGAVLLLREAIEAQDAAHAQLQQRFPLNP